MKRSDLVAIQDLSKLRDELTSRVAQAQALRFYLTLDGGYHSIDVDLKQVVAGPLVAALEQRIDEVDRQLVALGCDPD